MVTNSEEAKTEVAKIFFLRKFSCDFEGYGLGLGVLVWYLNLPLMVLATVKNDPMNSEIE